MVFGILNILTRGDGGSKIWKNWLTSYVNNPIREKLYLLVIAGACVKIAVINICLERRPKNLQLEPLKRYVQQQITADACNVLLLEFVNKF